MPSLNDIKQNLALKPFKKKEYRVWNLAGDETIMDKPKIPEKEKVTKRYQLDNKKVSIREQKGNKKTTNGYQLDNKKETKREQIGNELDNKKILEDPSFETLYESIQKLSGLQKKLFFYILEQCNLSGELFTNNINTKNLSLIIGCSYPTLKISILRLNRKFLITRLKGKRARGGFIKFLISKEVKVAGNRVLNETRLLNQEFEEFIFSIRQQLGNTKGNNQDTSSSNYINNKNTTTNDLPEEWQNINIDPLTGIGFSNTQLKQLYRLNITIPEVVQESIYHFSFGLNNNSKFKGYREPLNVLMGVLRKGESWEEPKYKSHSEIAMENLLAKKKEERERIKQLKDESYKLALEEWQESLSQEQLEEIAPAKKGKGDLMPQSVKLSIYFKENIWPKLKSEYLIE